MILAEAITMPEAVAMIGFFALLAFCQWIEHRR